MEYYYNEQYLVINSYNLATIYSNLVTDYQTLVTIPESGNDTGIWSNHSNRVMNKWNVDDRYWAALVVAWMRCDETRLGRNHGQSWLHLQSSLRRPRRSQQSNNIPDRPDRTSDYCPTALQSITKPALNAIHTINQTFLCQTEETNSHKLRITHSRVDRPKKIELRDNSNYTK